MRKDARINTKWKRERGFKLFSDGLDNATIARRLNVNPCTVGTWRRENRAIENRQSKIANR
jgi:uncharacterized protein YjcR